MLIETEKISEKILIPESLWQQQMLDHEQKVDDLIGEYLKARSRHVKNPVLDFLFQYYAFRPAALRRWSPGIGVTLQFSNPAHLPEISEIKIEGNEAFIDPELFSAKRISSLKWILSLLENSRDNRPSFGCFGMHEWAMVYKTNQPRHDQVPLRMNPEELAAFVESRPLLCTHYDAFRFFTEPARPMNRFELSRESFNETEQPGCIHSNMDLYKWAFKMYPWTPSNLIISAFELALESRRIDMQASPYDLEDEGLEPIKIETEEGRKIYRSKQQDIFKKGVPIREKLIEAYRNLIELVCRED